MVGTNMPAISDSQQHSGATLLSGSVTPIQSIALSPQLLSKFRINIIEPLVAKWKETKGHRDVASAKENSLITQKAGGDGTPSAFSPRVSSLAHENPLVLAFIHANYSNRNTIPASVAVLSDLRTILAPINQSVMDDAQECAEFLISQDTEDFKTSSSWFRVPPHPEELRSITDVGLHAYLALREKKQSAVRAAEIKLRKMSGAGGGGSSGAMSPVHHIVAGYLKRVLGRVSGGGVVTESMRKMICDLYANSSADKEPRMSASDKAIVLALLNVNPQRRALIDTVARVAHKILMNDPVEASSLAVVIPITNVEVCGGGELVKLMESNGGFGAGGERNAEQELRHLNEMRALRGSCFDAWNKILGLLYSDPERFFACP